MKLFLIGFIFCFQSSFGQTDSLVHYFYKIGWTLKFPEEFKSIDPRNTFDTIKEESNTDSNLNIEFERHMIIMGKGNNAFCFTYFNSRDRSITNENLDEANSVFKNAFFDKFIKSNNIRDSITTTETLQGVKFYEFKSTVLGVDNTPIYYTYLATLHNGYYICLIYIFTDKIVGGELENMFKTSKFDK